MFHGSAGLTRMNQIGTVWSKYSYRSEWYVLYSEWEVVLSMSLIKMDRLRSSKKIRWFPSASPNSNRVIVPNIQQRLESLANFYVERKRYTDDEHGQRIVRELDRISFGEMISGSSGDSFKARDKNCWTLSWWGLDESGRFKDFVDSVVHPWCSAG